MAFQLKNWTSIVASTLNHFRGTTSRVTDFNIGSVVRTILESLAIEIDEFYQKMFHGLREAIPVATYNTFDFARLAASPATGVIRVTITSAAVATVIPAGTVFSSAAARLTYLSQNGVTIAPGGTYADVSVVAASSGAAGNIPAAVAFTVNPSIAGFVSAANAIPLVNGREVEADAERKQRFGSYIEALQRSTTSALIYGAKTAALFNASGIETERVKAVSIIEPYVADSAQPISLVNVYVHNGVGATSGALVAEVVKIIHGYVDDAGVKVPGWKAAGVKVTVAAATETTQAVTGVITAEPGYVASALCALATEALSEYILALDIGEAYVVAHAVVLVSSIAGVANIVFSLPTADVDPAATNKLMPGAIAITAA
ncbi:baseplate J/gp47 family protein [Phenylobacterium ferrooxidans]|uniref:Baseplate J/gp47 family protein n=1 Tax=Phenylobacterium ferrooxidans TaxID=2982689 RepID=A0ABW6CKE2_9CAUL